MSFVLAISDHFKGTRYYESGGVIRDDLFIRNTECVADAVHFKTRERAERCRAELIKTAPDAVAYRVICFLDL